MAPKFPSPAGRYLALLLIALAVSTQAANSVSFEHEARRFLQASERKGMGWVITNFPLKGRTSCDATFYHSPLVLNITRPDRSTFCFDISHKTPEAVKYACQQPANAGQVGRVQVLAAPGCGEAVVGVTVDGRPWSNYTYDDDSSILSIDRIATVPPPDAANPADHIVCVFLRPISTANDTTTTTAASSSCGTVTSFCAPTYGPDPACAVLVADNKGVCCPVNRISYDKAVVAPGGLLYTVFGRLTAGCESIVSEGDLLEAMATQYRSALGLPRGSIQFQSYSCRAGRITAAFRATGLTLNAPDLILQRSATLLRPLATLVGLVGVRAVLYTPPPPPPLQAPPPPPPPPRQPAIPPGPPPTEPSPLPAPSHPNVPARGAPPRDDLPEPSHYASRPPPVYGAY